MSMATSAEFSKGSQEPRPLEAGFFVTLLLLMCVITAVATRGYLNAVEGNGDNSNYARVTDAILARNLTSAGTVYQFWGLSYCAALLCAVVRTNAFQAIGIISFLSTVTSVILVAELWSGWIAVYFVATSYALLEFGAFGGADSLFLLLVLISLRFARHSQWAGCSLAGALSATVRPLGVMVLAGVCIHLRRNLKVLGLVLGIAAGIYLLYSAPLVFYLGDPLLNWTGYQQQDWGGHAPIGWPLAALIGNVRNGENVGNLPMLILKIAYIGFHMAALVGLCVSPKRRRELFKHRPEGITVILYSVFLLTYNAPTWAASIYPRLLMPITPMLLDVYSDMLPRNRLLPAALGLMSVALAIGSNLGWSGVRIFLHI